MFREGLSVFIIKSRIQLSIIQPKVPKKVGVFVQNNIYYSTAIWKWKQALL